MDLERSSTTIINSSFAKFEDIRIIDIDDTKDVNARFGKKFYLESLLSLLNRFDWSFALTYLPLTPQKLNTPVFGYAYKYNIPNDFIRLCETNCTNNNCVKMGKAYYTNINNLTIIYVKYVTDPNEFSCLFTEALSWMIAGSLACPLKVDIKMSSAFLQNGMRVCKEAICADQTDSYRVTALMSDQIRARLTDSNLLSYDQDVYKDWGMVK